DSGVEIDHPDLRDNVWTNPREVAGNGRDDDGNGYVDDVHGWDFIGGRDGRDVAQDTYESVRLYARYRGRFEGANPDTLTAAARAEYQRFAEYKRKYEADRAEAQQQLQQIREFSTNYDRILATLRSQLGPSSVLTVEKVRGLQTIRQDVMQARGIFLQLVGQGITPELVERETKSVQDRLQYGLNPAFDPRGIVGDNYADPRERGYGNAEVEGPDASHGTHVAGILGAARGNGAGIDGVASGVRIMVLRAVPDGDERDKDVANAIRYAVDNGAQIISMSFGKAFSPEKEVVDEAVRYADQKGVLMVHAAGNGGANLDTEPSFPNRYYQTGGGSARNWIEVGASTWAPADSLAAPFSNYSATKVDLFAPGMSIYSTVTDGEYERNDGTSMAAPVVSGVAALLMAYFPQLTADQVRAIILESATPYREQSVARPGGEGRVAFGQLSATGGVVNAYNAVRLARQRTGEGN
ncbi:MAG TPA: S8 family peptidase, partial [Longimicrobiaceae bacterium]|nr:S8 family peptidase [Longimicrobiaceae bacterium]